MIKFDNVSKLYPDGTAALNGITLTIDAKDFVFLVGSSGAGKTTLIKLLIHEEEPTAGTIFLDSTDITNLKAEDLPELRRKIGVVFQDFKLLDSKTVFENVAVALEVVDRPAEEIKQIVPNVLNMVGLGQKLNCFPKQLSGGEKQRVSIARALAHEPKVLVADEPTGNIDPAAREEIILILDKVNSLGTTVIMATHEAEIVNRMKKRVVTLSKGKIIKDQKEGKYEL